MIYIIVIGFMVLYLIHLYYFKKTKLKNQLVITIVYSIVILSLAFISYKYSYFINSTIYLIGELLIISGIITARLQYNYYPEISKAIFSKKGFIQFLSILGLLYLLLSLYSKIYFWYVCGGSILLFVIIDWIAYMLKLFYNPGFEKYSNIYDLVSFDSQLAAKIKNLIGNKNIKLYYYNGQRINAHLYSANIKNFSIIISSKALQELKSTELFSILLHEKAHLVKKHRLQLFLFSLLGNLIILCIFNIVMWFSIKKVSVDFGMCFFLLIAEVIMDFFQLSRNYIVHKQELKADLYVCNMGYKNDLLSTFYKIADNTEYSPVINLRYYILNKRPLIQYRINNICKYAKKR